MSALGATRRLARVRVSLDLRARLAALAPDPRLRVRLAALLAVAVLLAAAYMFWLRDSELVRVETVTVTGITELAGRDAGRVRSTLEEAGLQMTTLHVDRGRLERVSAAFPIVQAIEVRPDFPSGLRIHVVEHRPVAVLVAGERRVAVAADGSVLSGVPAGRSLPAVETRSAAPGERLKPGATLDAVRVAGGAPAAIAGRMEAVERDSERGVVVALEDGPDLVFGEPTRLAAKWAAAVRVLADPDSGGAEYVDVRIPERPAAGGLAVETVAPVAPAGSAGSGGLGVEAPVPAVTGPAAIPEALAVPAEPVDPAPPAIVDSGESAPGETAPDPGGGAVAEPQP